MKFLSLLVAVCATGFAQAPAPAMKSVTGEVTSVNPGSKQIELKADGAGTVYQISVGDTARLLRMPLGETDLKKASAINLGDISVGDRAQARGPLADGANAFSARTVLIMTKGDLAKKQEQDRAAWEQRGIVGTVSSTDPSTGQFTVKLRGRDSNSLVVDAAGAGSVRRYGAGSVKFADSLPSKVADIRTGDTIRVLGAKSEDGSRMKAEEIVFGSFATIPGTVSAVDAENGIVRIQDLNAKKPVEVAINKDTLVRRLPDMMAKGMAARMRGGDTAAGPAGGGPGAAAASGGGPAGAAGGPGAGARMGGGARMQGDLSQMLQRLPALPLSELKAGDAVIVSTARSGDSSKVMAIALVAGVEPFLEAAPRSAGAINLGSWNLDGGIPEQ